MTLETRTVTLSAEQWFFVEALVEDSQAHAVKTADAIDSVRFPEVVATHRADADFTHTILTSLRSAGA
ncbi:hypothetical protein [Roseomonas haemaphysalidis]|uniref:Transcriptional regulator n=1 Tax=Roseomonas haemaphysalidis TaxID=2768162 RepID=A0ABS3KTX1_9PROT|nr:hypothetical protein [Roseomonas haemaphysalidis]MBO1080869.1 hypothetical protein [Roseomonas haemaphysalidis]